MHRLPRALPLATLAAWVLGATACGSAFEAGTGSDSGASDGTTNDVVIHGGGGDGAGGDSGSPVEAGVDASSCAAGQECVRAPATWQGPVLVYQGSGPPPACQAPGTVAFQGGAGTLNAPPASCTTCTCGDPSGVKCSDPTVVLYTDTACLGAVYIMGSAASECTELDVDAGGAAHLSNPIYAVVGTSTASGGSCAPSLSSITKPPATWPTNVVGCTSPATQVACGVGEVCAPVPQNGMSLCVYQAGSTGICPLHYTTMSVVYTGVNDERGCTACQCGPTTGTCTGGEVAFSGSMDCSNSTTIAAGASCTLTNTGTGDNWVELSTPPAAKGSACAPSGGQAQGSASGSSPITLCCQ